MSLEREAAVSRRIARVPEAACGGVKSVLAVCGQDTKISQAAQQRDSLLLRFKSEDEVSSLSQDACLY
jgi:hypothetical protein